MAWRRSHNNSLGSSNAWGPTHVDDTNVLSNLSSNPFAKFSKVRIA